MVLVVPGNSPSDSLLEGDRRAITQQVFCLANVGTRVRDITGLVGHHLDFGSLASVLLDQIDELLQRRAAPLAEVEDLVLVRPINGSDDAIHDVIDVGVIAAAAAVAELLYFHPPTHPVNELERGHVGPAIVAVHGEEAQSRHIQVVEMVVRVGQKFAGLFGGGVGRHGVVHDLVFTEVGRFGSTVHGTGTGKDKVLHVVLGRKFHQARRSLDIGVDVHVRIIDGGPDPGAGGHVAHPLDAFRFEDLGHEILVADVAFVDGQALLGRVLGPEPVEVGALDPDVVVVVHLVHDNDVVSARQQRIGHVAADETGPTRHQHSLLPRVGLHDLRVRPRVVANGGRGVRRGGDRSSITLGTVRVVGGGSDCLNRKVHLVAVVVNGCGKCFSMMIRFGIVSLRRSVGMRDSVTEGVIRSSEGIVVRWCEVAAHNSRDNSRRVGTGTAQKKKTNECDSHKVIHRIGCYYCLLSA
jgi:hypothetical protein